MSKRPDIGIKPWEPYPERTHSDIEPFLCEECGEVYLGSSLGRSAYCVKCRKKHQADPHRCRPYAPHLWDRELVARFRPDPIETWKAIRLEIRNYNTKHKENT